MLVKRTRDSVIDALVAQYRKQLEATLLNVPQTLDFPEEFARLKMNAYAVSDDIRE